MARLFKRGRIWWCWGYDVDGRRWRESTHQVERRAAELAARELERRFAADPTARSRSKLTLEKALQAVIAYQEKAGRAPATVRATTYHIEHMLGHLDAGMPLSSVTLAHTTQYLADRLEEGAHRHTVAKEIRTLTQAMRRAAKAGVFVPRVDPTHLIPDELGKVYSPRERWLTVDEYRALLAELRASADHHSSSTDRGDYLVMYCQVGVRKTELFTIRPEHYDPERHALWVDGTKTDGAARWVPLTAEAELVLARRIQEAGDGPPFPVWHTVCRDLARACERVERRWNPDFDFEACDPETDEPVEPPRPFPPVTPNDLRRTFCTWLCNENVPERTAAALMGHKSTVMVRTVYGRIDRVAMAGAVSALETVTWAVTDSAASTEQATPLRDAAFAKVLEKSIETDGQSKRSRGDSNTRPVA